MNATFILPILYVMRAIRSSALFAFLLFSIGLMADLDTSIASLRNLGAMPVDSVIMSPFDTLCHTGAPYQLDHAIPAGGTWSGEGVTDNFFFPSVAGEFVLEYRVFDGSANDTITALQTMVVVQPSIALVSGSEDDCDLAPMVYQGSPINGVWSGIADANGVVDKSCSARPNGGPAVYSYLAVNGECHASTPMFDLLECTPVDLGPDLLMCNFGDALTIDLYMPSLGFGQLNGFDDVLQENDPFAPALHGHFYAGKPPGEYLVSGNATGPGACTGYDTLLITVIAPPEVTILAGGAPNSCDTVPLVLQGSPLGGIWSGLADENGIVDRSCQARPFEGPVYYSFPADNGDCVNLFFVSGQFCMTVHVAPDTTLCAESAPIVTYLSNSQMAGPGYLEGYDSLYVDGTVAIGTFFPALHEPGTYLLWGTAGGPNVCPGYDSAYVTIAPAATVAHGLTIEEMLINDPPIELSGGAPANGSYTLNGEVIMQFDPAVAGVGLHAIVYAATDEITGCIGTDTAYIQVDVMSAMEGSIPERYQIHPNPANERLIIHCGSDQRIVIRDITGKKLAEWRSVSDRTIIDVSRFTAGTYLLGIEGGQRSSQHVILIE